jgi:hypothetical protein
MFLETLVLAYKAICRHNPRTLHLSPENGGRMFLRNVGIRLEDHNLNNYPCEHLCTYNSFHFDLSFPPVSSHRTSCSDCSRLVSGDGGFESWPGHQLSCRDFRSFPVSLGKSFPIHYSPIVLLPHAALSAMPTAP